MTKLSELATSPRVDIAFLTESDRMTFTACHIDNVDVFQLRNGAHSFFVQNVAVTKLSTVASSPREYHALVIDCSCVIVAERKFCNRVLLEVF